MQPTLVILAAGMGSRYGGLKQIDPVGPSGETIMDYAVHDAIRAGFGKLVFVIREAFEVDFRARTEARYGDRIPIAYVHQRLDDVPAGFIPPPDREKPWGTAHAIYSARHAVDTPFAVINADDFYGAESFRLLADRIVRPDFNAAVLPDTYCMVGFTLRNTLSEHGVVSRGICTVDAAGRLVGIEEHTGIAAGPDGAITGYDVSGQAHSLSGDETVSMNMWGFPRMFFDRIADRFAAFLDALTAVGPAIAVKSEFYIPSLVNVLMHDGQAIVEVLASPADWFGVTYREDRPRVAAAIQALVARGDYPSNLWNA